jgi:hypothetical protein
MTETEVTMMRRPQLFISAVFKQPQKQRRRKQEQYARKGKKSTRLLISKRQTA